MKNIFDRIDVFWGIALALGLNIGWMYIHGIHWAFLGIILSGIIYAFTRNWLVENYVKQRIKENDKIRTNIKLPRIQKNIKSISCKTRINRRYRRNV